MIPLLITLGPPMDRLSGAYFYGLAISLEPLGGLTHETTVVNAYGVMHTAKGTIDGLLKQQLVRLKTSLGPCANLRSGLESAMGELIRDLDKLEEPIGVVIAGDIRARFTYFRNAFWAEINVADFYAITPKGAYDTTKLAEEGITAFHPDLALKVPSTILDARQAARCIAFDLPTAAAFHLHRVNEGVMRAYYDAVTGGKPRPEHRNIGAYIDAMKKEKVQIKLPEAKAVYGVLAMIAHHHRNPVLHPDDVLENVEQALSLLGIIRTATELMLKELKPPPLVLTPSPNPLLRDAVESLTAPKDSPDDPKEAKDD